MSLGQESLNIKKRTNLYLALVHYPVYDKNKRVVSTALTNLDIHDIARAARTFGIAKYYLVTPLKKQQRLAKRILSHWGLGLGAEYNPNRKEALELVKIADSLDDVCEDIYRHWKVKPKTVITDAKPFEKSIGYLDLKKLIEQESNPYLLLLGTGWGITEDVIRNSDYVLAPIRGNTDYYHLSVRSAAAIILDRLLGIR
ncbi:MAG: RNA methyltransferase [Pseudomonadota bacterium]